MNRSKLTGLWRAGDESGRPGFRLQFEYDPGLIERLKRAIPHTERSWDAEDKTWWVSEAYAEQLRGLFGNFASLAYAQATLFTDERFSEICPLHNCQLPCMECGARP